MRDTQKRKVVELSINLEEDDTEKGVIEEANDENASKSHVNLRYTPQTSFLLNE